MIVYTLSPFDLLPEALLGPIGLIDDSAVALNLVRQFGGLVVDFFREEPLRDRERMNTNRNVNNNNNSNASFGRRVAAGAVASNVNPYGNVDSSSNESQRASRNPYPSI